MTARRLLFCAALVLAATSAAAQTDYESVRAPAIQQLGAHLQNGDLAAATADLQSYVEVHPGDAVMQYNLACLQCLAGDSETSLTTLEQALAAGYPDLERPLHDPDLVRLADDPRLQAVLDAARDSRLAAMRSVEVYLEERVGSDPLALAPDPRAPGADARGGLVELAYSVDGLVIGITPPASGADEAIVCIALPRSLDDYATERWFEFRAPLDRPGRAPRTARHGRPDPDPEAAFVVRDDPDRRDLHIPWRSLHPYRPPVELLLGLDVTLIRDDATVPNPRWSLVPDPHAGSTLVRERRFAPVILDPGLDPESDIAGRLDTRLVVGDSLSAEIGLQGIDGGEVTVTCLVDGAVDTVVAAVLEPDLAYLTVPFSLPPDSLAGWHELTVQVGDLDWSDRCFRLPPDWFLSRNQRLDDLPPGERTLVQYHLFRILRGQQSFHPHDDPTALATAALTAEALLQHAEQAGSVLPSGPVAIAGAFPVGDDALQGCRLVLPRADLRPAGPLVVVVVDHARQAALAGALDEHRGPQDPRTFLVTSVALVPGQPAASAAVVGEAVAWGRTLVGTDAVQLAGMPGMSPPMMLAAQQRAEPPMPLLLLAPGPHPFASGKWPATVTAVEEPGDDPVDWADTILANRR